MKMTTQTLTLAVRWLLGGILIISVIVRLLNPNTQAGIPPQALAWFNAMTDTGYMMPFLLLSEALVGLALVTGRFVPLALIIFAPINLNIFLLHALLDPRPLRLVQIALMASTHLYLVWYYWVSFKVIVFSPNQPTALSIVTTARWDIGIVLRSVLGALFFITGLAKIFGLANVDAPFLLAMRDTGYLYILLGMLELSIGVMLISGRFVVLALTMLAPIIVNILLFHLFLDRTSPLALVSLIAGFILAYLAWQHRDRYCVLFNV
jgi:putative oxidoreductase